MVQFLHPHGIGSSRSLARLSSRKLFEEYLCNPQRGWLYCTFHQTKCCISELNLVQVPMKTAQLTVLGAAGFLLGNYVGSFSVPGMGVLHGWAMGGFAVGLRQQHRVGNS